MKKIIKNKQKQDKCILKYLDKLWRDIAGGKKKKKRRLMVNDSSFSRKVILFIVHFLPSVKSITGLFKEVVQDSGVSLTSYNYPTGIPCC